MQIPNPNALLIGKKGQEKKKRMRDVVSLEEQPTGRHYERHWA